MELCIRWPKKVLLKQIKPIYLQYSLFLKEFESKKGKQVRSFSGYRIQIDLDVCEHSSRFELYLNFIPLQ